MHNYGTVITWSTVSAPKPFGGIAENYSYKDAYQEERIPGENGSTAALILRLRKGDISFDSTATDESTDFLDLSSGAGITVSGLSAGVVICTEAVEKWTKGEAKNLALKATHYPNITGSGPAAGTLAANTPTQSGLIIHPNAKVIWGTTGLSHTAGNVESLTLTQKWEVKEHDNGMQYDAVRVENFERRINLDILCVGANPAPPALDSVLVVAGAPAHAGNMVVVNHEIKWAKGREKMFTVEAMWLASLAESED